VTVTLDQVLPWGRSLDEYRRMFALSDGDLERRILGCGDGPASFNAEMAARGRRVVSVDPIYAFTASDIERQVYDTNPIITDQVRQSREDYLWHEFADESDLARHRLATMRRFLADYESGRGEGRYVSEELPRLGFADETFDLALCSHLLFLYTEQLSLDFHQQAIREMCRVAREARIFPLLALDCTESQHVEPVRAALAADGFAVDVVRVPYEFLRGGNEMLRVRRDQLQQK
jgi:SAM-dependent methyltransferase